MTESREAPGEAFANVVYASDGLQAVILIATVLVAVSLVFPLLVKKH
jgi:hypothetical protein